MKKSRAKNQGLKFSTAGLDLLFAEYEAMLTAYLNLSWHEYWWDQRPEHDTPHNHQPQIKTGARLEWWARRGRAQEIERRGRQVHKLHVALYQARNFFLTALHSQLRHD